MLKFEGVLTATPRGGGGTLVPIPKGVAVKLGLKGMPKIKKAAAAWEKLSLTNRKELALGLTSAKKPETRQRRLAAALERLRR